MPTYSVPQLISDIELQLNQGAISDDTELSRSQIAYWIEYELNTLVQQECEVALKLGKPLPGIYISRAAGLTASEETYIISVLNYSTLSDPLNARTDRTFYVEQDETIDGYLYPGKSYYKYSKTVNSVPQFINITKQEAETRDYNQRNRINISGYSILTLSKDSGIVRLLTDEYELINKTSVDTLDMVKDLRFAGPTADRLVWYRGGDFIYIEGIHDPELYDRVFIMDYVMRQAVSESGSLQISDIIYPVLVDKVVQRGKLQMYGTVPDIINDGVDTKQSVYHTAIANPSSKTEQAQ